MGKKDKDFKFVVDGAFSKCSQVWSVKIRKSEVYIMDCRGKEHKISLHSSGICHSAVTREASARFSLSPKQRRNVEWKLSLNHGESAIAFSIIFPYDQITFSPDNLNIAADVFHISPPSIGEAVVVQFYKTKADGNNVQYTIADGLHLLHSVVLESGDVLSVIYYYTNNFNDLINEAKKRLRNFAQKQPCPPNLVLTSGFVTVFDQASIPYHIEINLK